MLTKEEYPVLHLNEKSRQLLEENEQVFMKAAKERKVEKKEKKMRKSSEFTGEADPSLFAQLRELRLAIAKEERVPPYIVFSDKTLAHMCILRPKTKEEMLQVTGVGEKKYEKYGERFLALLAALEKGNEKS
mgnify:CR=1 FL=1